MAFHTTLLSHQWRRKSDDGQEASSSSSSRTSIARNIDAITPFRVQQIRLLQADLHPRLLSMLHLAEDLKSWLRKKSFSIVSGDMGKYVNESFYPFLSEKDLRESILKETPVQRNIDPLKISDHSLAKLVKSRQEIFDWKRSWNWSVKNQRCPSSNMHVMDDHWKSSNLGKLREKRSSLFERYY